MPETANGSGGKPAPVTQTENIDAAEETENPFSPRLLYLLTSPRFPA